MCFLFMIVENVLELIDHNQSIMIKEGEKLSEVVKVLSNLISYKKNSRSEL